MNSKVLYQKGLHITDISIQHGGRICIMSGGVGGEFCLYIPIASEYPLLQVLYRNESLRERFKYLIQKEKGRKRKKQLVALIIKQFSSTQRDPIDTLLEVLKKNNIESTSEYWPNR